MKPIKLTDKETGAVYVSYQQERAMTEVLVGPRVWQIFADGSFQLDWESPDFGLTDDWTCYSFEYHRFLVEDYEIPMIDPTLMDWGVYPP